MVYQVLVFKASSLAAALASLAAASGIWGVSVILLRIFSKSEVERLPGGQKIAKILEKHRWIG